MKSFTELGFIFLRFVQVKMTFLQVRQHCNSINFHKYFREPEPTSLARITNFNRHNGNIFWDKLNKANGFWPEAIYNVDETGITTVQKPSRIVAEKGVKQVGSVVSQEWSELVTLCCGVKPIGDTVPPCFVFPRVMLLTVGC